MPQDEPWSWKKFAKGPFVGKNWAKAIVLTTIQIVIALIIGAVAFTAWNLFLRPKATHQQVSDTKIGGNVGSLSNADNHSTTNETVYQFPLSSLFNFGSKDKKVVKDNG